MKFSLRNILLLCLAFPWSIGLTQDPKYNDKHIEVALRMVGHQTLLSSGDSTSRVLPIQKEGNDYIISFERELTLDPDRLLKTSKEVFETQDLPSAFIVEVHECDSNQVVYSFEVLNEEGRNLSPCSGRALPYGCYTIVFSFNAMTATTQNEDLASVGSKGQTRSYIMILLLFLSSGILIYLSRRKKQSSNESNHIKLGTILFDRNSGELIIEGNRTELSGKENDLLDLLYQSANKTVRREEILKEVWGDEGDYVGRTLDVFISKLRKKLESDENVKISNIRGVGYKLVLRDLVSKSND